MEIIIIESFGSFLVTLINWGQEEMTLGRVKTQSEAYQFARAIVQSFERANLECKFDERG